jgi:hypothetical protein
MEDDKQINRSSLLVMTFELEGLCNGLRCTVPNGLAPSSTTVAIMNRLIAEFSRKAEGCVLDDLPPLDENTSPVDLLIVAEMLRATLMSFLTPDERDARDRTFGFASAQDRP